jgi:hypothetical protein
MVIMLNKVRARYFVAWEWASTNQCYFYPREISVNISAVSASSSSSASLIVWRASSPNVDSALATASTWARPSASVSGYPRSHSVVQSGQLILHGVDEFSLLCEGVIFHVLRGLLRFG